MPSLLTVVSYSRVRMYLLLSYKFSICCGLTSWLYNVLGLLQLQSQNGWLPLLWLYKMASLLPAVQYRDAVHESDSLFNTLLRLSNIKDVCKSQTLAHTTFAVSLQYGIENKKRQILHIQCTQVSTEFLWKKQLWHYLYRCIVFHCSSPEYAFWWLLSQWVLHQKKSKKGPENVHMLFLPGQTRDLESGREKQHRWLDLILCTFTSRITKQINDRNETI